jgi:Nif-specific regulatory protein
MTTSVGAWKPSLGDAQTPEIRRLTSLLEVSQALSGASNVKAALHHILEILSRHHGAARSSVTLVQEDGELRVEASDSLDKSSTSGQRLGKGITGRVIETGLPIVVPRVTEIIVPRHASKRHERSEQQFSCVCVPIVLNRKTVGALAVDLEFEVDRDYDRTAEFFSAITLMIGQAVKVQRLLEADRRRLEEENAHLWQQLRERYDYSNIIGTSGPVRRMREQVEHVAGTSTNVLIRGEPGTGKELVAHAIHYNSLRAKEPFVKVNCAALPHSAIESELFGYEKGAFSGAELRKKGRFEVAEGGTLFLDDIGDLNLGTQVKLLRLMDKREFERLGGSAAIKTNVRLLAATNKDLEKGVADGTFREDLYYRLNLFTIFVPPLRERKTDLVLLADHFLEKLSRKQQKGVKQLSRAAIDILMSYDWPGNVRELENVLERAGLVSEGQAIQAHHLPLSLQSSSESFDLTTRVSLSDALNACAKDMIRKALKTTRGNRANAARLLRTTERVLGYQVKKLGIDSRRFRR